MDDAVVSLLVGDAYRCERALRVRHHAVCSNDPHVERHVRFADDVDVAALDMELRSQSLFSLARHFVIRRMERARTPKAWVEVLEQAPAPGTFVTLLAEDLKASSPILKAVTKKGTVDRLPSPRRANDFAKAAEQVLAEQDVELPPRAVRELVLRCDSLLALSQEARKLRAYTASASIDPDRLAQIVFPLAEQTVYPFYDQLGGRNLPAALRSLDQLRESPVRVLGGIIRHVTRLATVRILLEAKVPRPAMASAIGVPDWLLRRLIGQASHFRRDELLDCVRTGLDLDVRVKSGELAPSDAVLQLMFAITQSHLG